MKIAAAVVTYNRSKLLQECLHSLLNQKGVSVDEIFVVNNASTDQTATVLKEIQKNHSSVNVLENASNRGGAEGFYQAIEAAYNSGADWIWVMDDDAIPTEDALSFLLSSEKSKEATTGVLGCVVLNEKKDLFLPNLQCKVDRKNFTFNAVKIGSDAIDVDTNSFVGFLMHRRAIDAVGLPDKTFFIWYDDIEYSLRISSKLKIWLIPQAKIIHKAHARNDEKKHWLFRAKVPVYNWADCWRLYYGNRNRFVVQRKLSGPLRFHIDFFKFTLKELLIPVLFTQDHFLDRVSLALKASIDGYRGKTGKTIQTVPPFEKDAR